MHLQKSQENTAFSGSQRFVEPSFWGSVIPAQAGIQIATLDCHLRGNDNQTLFLVLTWHQSRF